MALTPQDLIDSLATINITDRPGLDAFLKGSNEIVGGFTAAGLDTQPAVLQLLEGAKVPLEQAQISNMIAQERAAQAAAVQASEAKIQALTKKSQDLVSGAAGQGV